MAKNNNLTDFLTEIANLLRNMFAISGPINPQNFYNVIYAGVQSRYNDGYAEGTTAGYSNGYSIGKEEGLASGYTLGLTEEQAVEDALISGTLTTYTHSRRISLRSHAISSCANLQTVDLPNCTGIAHYVFQDCTSLNYVNLPKIKGLGASTFAGCTILPTIVLPGVMSVALSSFKGCTSLHTVDLPLASSLASSSFNNTSSLTSLILRRTSGVCSLSATNVFTGSSSTFYVYVPAAFIEQYKVATNWITYATRFRALENYTVDGTVSGALDPTKI